MKIATFALLAMTSALAGCALPQVNLPATTLESSWYSPTEGVDHVLLWTREADRDTEVMREKLGFNVVEGGTFPGDIANRLALFRDQSFLELLYFTIPISEVGPEGLSGLSFLQAADGSVGFGIRADNLEATAARVAATGLPVGEPSPGAYDPDGPEGPLTTTAVEYRTFGFPEAPIAGLDPFFVWYAPNPARAPEGQARWQSRTSHANTAARLTAVWIVTADTNASSAALVRMGFAPRQPTPIPRLSAIGTVFDGGRSAVLLIEPRGRGVAAEALRVRGPHVLGVSIEVEDLESARAVIGQGYGAPTRIYRGVFGASILAPTQDDLGVLFEFHQASQRSGN